MDNLRSRLNDKSSFLDLVRATKTPFELEPRDFAETFSRCHDTKDVADIEGRVARVLFYAHLRDKPYKNPSASEYLEGMRKFVADGGRIDIGIQNPEILQRLTADTLASKEILVSGLGNTKWIDALWDKAHEACAHSSWKYIPEGRNEVEWRKLGWDFYTLYERALGYESDCFRQKLDNTTKD